MIRKTITPDSYDETPIPHLLSKRLVCKCHSVGCFYREDSSRNLIALLVLWSRNLEQIGEQLESMLILDLFHMFLAFSMNKALCCPFVLWDCGRGYFWGSFCWLDFALSSKTIHNFGCLNLHGVIPILCSSSNQRQELFL